MIGEEEFPFPSAFTLGDAPLVHEATGLEFDEWAERYDRLEENPRDVRTITGVIAIAVSRARPSWSRAKVIQYLNQVDLAGLHLEGGDDADPPAEGPAESRSAGSSTGSTTTAEDTSEAQS